VGVNSDNQNSIFGTIENSYATGSVSGGSESIIGGLVGFSNGTISNSYATGPALGGEILTLEDSWGGTKQSSMMRASTTRIRPAA